MLSRFIQKRNYTLKQIMDFSLPIPKPKANAISQCCLFTYPRINAITQCCLFTCPRINVAKLHYKPSVPPSSSVCVFRLPKI